MKHMLASGTIFGAKLLRCEAGNMCKVLLMYVVRATELHAVCIAMK